VNVVVRFPTVERRLVTHRDRPKSARNRPFEIANVALVAAQGTSGQVSYSTNCWAARAAFRSMITIQEAGNEVMKLTRISPSPFSADNI